MPLSEPPTIGEMFRRLDRMETSIMGELHSLRRDTVSAQVFDQIIKQIHDDIDELEADVAAQAVTRRQVLVGAFLLLLGEILAITIALSNLAARTSGLVP